LSDVHPPRPDGSTSSTPGLHQHIELMLIKMNALAVDEVRKLMDKP
jgi:hypothetical protein